MKKHEFILVGLAAAAVAFYLAGTAQGTGIYNTPVVGSLLGTLYSTGNNA